MSNRIHQEGNDTNKLASSRLMRTLQITLVMHVRWIGRRNACWRLTYLRQACGICMPGEAVTVKEEDFVVNRVQIGKTLSSSLVEVSKWDTFASHLPVVQDTLALLIKALQRA